ncbi:recombinase family protein [Nocardioides sp. SOB44]|uniref:Recombinase family protein n=1 Tax=Nocardioides cremeus TaxID=3058044 RepID=A0ABT8TLQ3_9ACTN|nr:recombinase family protein [Nocardioides cremeus]MDO3394898.1 recombinase family protein [Nocardioides cremeus]
MDVTIYCRLSEDKHGTTLGVQRQEEECRALAKERGWTVREVLIDNDLSATTGVRRPAFEQLLTRKPEAIVCWHIDRLLRLTRDLERVIELGVNVYAVHAGYLDLSTPAGRAVARTVTAWTTYEGEQKAERQKASHRQRVRSGKPWWPTRPFGFEMDGSHREDEAEMLRAVYAGILEGKALTRMAKMLNEAEMLTPKGNQWRGASLKPVLMNARNAGLYVYNGEEVGQASWEPIVAEDVYRATVRTLSTPERRANFGRGGYNRRENLLTGIATCSRCSSTVRAAWRRGSDGERTYKVYQCSGKHCVTLPADWCDSVVTREVIKRVGEWRDLLPEGPDDDGIDIAALRVEEAALAARKAELGEMFAEGLIDRQALAGGVSRADTRLAELADVLADHAVRSTGLFVWDTETLWAWTDDGEGNVDVERFTPVVKRVCKRIDLTGPGKGRRDLLYGTHLTIEFNEPTRP